MPNLPIFCDNDDWEMTRSLVKETVLIPRPQLLETGYIKTRTELHIDRAIGLQTCTGNKPVYVQLSSAIDDMMFLSASNSSLKWQDISSGIEVHHHKMMHSGSSLAKKTHSERNVGWTRGFLSFNMLFLEVFGRWFLHIFFYAQSFTPFSNCEGWSKFCFVHTKFFVLKMLTTGSMQLKMVTWTLWSVWCKPEQIWRKLQRMVQHHWSLLPKVSN